MSKKVVIYSGIQPGKKGTGNFLSFFIEKFKEHNISYELINYKTPNTGFFARIAKRIGIAKFLRSIFFSIMRLISYKRKITNSTVIIFHPQSIGLNITSELIKNNYVYFFVLDSFFFCKKSYNYLNGNNACLKCITNPKASAENKCSFLLTNQSDLEYSYFQDSILTNLSTICFLTQNENQSLLLKEKFGQNINVKKLGMLIDLNSENQFDIAIENKSFDFVFHNTHAEAKGIKYFIELAKRMPQNSFLIPYSFGEIISYENQLNNIKNLTCISITWDTGLKNILKNCKIVLNPSLWSAPVEGAFLKSIMFHGCVAAVPTLFSFQSEIPNNVIIHLDDDIDKSVGILSTMLLSDSTIADYKSNSRRWIQEYQNVTNYDFDKFLKYEFFDFTIVENNLI